MGRPRTVNVEKYENRFKNHSFRISSDFNDLRNDIDWLLRENKDQRDELKALRFENKNLQKALDEAENEIEHVKENAEEYCNRCAENEYEVDRLESELSRVKAQKFDQITSQSKE